VQCSHLTDDALWRAITKNTDARSALFDGQLEAGTKGLPNFQTSAKFSISRAIDDLERQYQDYVTELRRRYSLVSSPEKTSNAGSDQAA
jgi:hypothetical protein